MFIDTHMHEMTCSKDSFLKLEQMVEIAREKGLGAICITDHDDMGLKEYAEEYAEKTGFPIFVGIEFFSLQGDIIAFGIEEYPDQRIPAQEFIDLVKRSGRELKDSKRSGRSGSPEWKYFCSSVPEGSKICTGTWTLYDGIQ